MTFGVDSSIDSSSSSNCVYEPLSLSCALRAAVCAQVPAAMLLMLGVVASTADGKSLDDP